MGHLKGKSTLMMYEQGGDLKIKYRNREFCIAATMEIGQEIMKENFGGY